MQEGKPAPIVASAVAPATPATPARSNDAAALAESKAAKSPELQCTTPPPTAAASTVPASTASAAAAKERAKKLVTAYFTQLTKGCGAATCDKSVRGSSRFTSIDSDCRVCCVVQYCKSNPAFVAAATPKDALTQALALVGAHKDAMLHVPLDV